jgi:hypothetical protein
MTRLKCGQWKCSNYKSEVNQYIDRRDHADKQAGRGPRKPELNDLLCNVHAGGMKRSRWRADPIPLGDKDRARLLKEKVKLDAEETAEREAASIEADERDARLHAQAWAELDATPEWFIASDDHGDYAGAEPTFTGKMWFDGGRDYDRNWFDIRPSERNYGGHGRNYPYVLRATRMANMTPNEARIMAEALVAGADKADELNALRAPKEDTDDRT